VLRLPAGNFLGVVSVVKVLLEESADETASFN